MNKFDKLVEAQCDFAVQKVIEITNLGWFTDEVAGYIESKTDRGVLTSWYEGKAVRHKITPYSIVYGE